MALFDSLLNLTPDQNQGLLSAAAQLLQAGGPSLRPTSFGQALGGGLQAFQQGISDAEQRRAQLQNQALNAKLLGLNIQNQETNRQRAKALQDFYLNRSQPTNPATQVPAGQTADLAPTVANANALPSPASPAIGGVGKQDLFRQNLQEAQALRAAGFGPEADAREAAALKFQPKIKDWQKVNVGGRVLFAPFFEDGTSGAPVPLDVAEKLQQVDTGGAQQLVNPFTGQVVTSTTKSATPGERLTASTAANRLAFDIGQANRPAFNAEAGGYILPVNKANPQGGLINIPGVQGKAPTEFQGKSAAFGLRADEANKTLNNLQGAYSPSAINSKLAVEGTPLVGGILGAATNKALSENDQRAEQAQRDFVNAILRQESGAAIGAQEFDNARKQYFPQPGDSQPVIDQKQRNRQLAVQALQANAGKAKLTAPSTSGWSITKVGE